MKDSLNNQCFIQAGSAISPQATFDSDDWSRQLIASDTNRMECIEPAYAAFIAPNSLRRMSRLLKMGLTTAMKCLQEAGITVPGAIITGTGKGSLQDTERFLKNIEEYSERALNPTPFIQSTYNAINGLIALQQQCTRYNNTFVNRGFSFENAMLDSLLYLREHPAETVLLGAFEEMTAEHFFIKERAGYWKPGVNNLNFLQQGNTPGSIAGEGTAYFCLSNQQDSRSLARLRDVEMLYKPGAEKLRSSLQHFLSSNELKVEDISLLLSGENGDARFQQYYDAVEAELGEVPKLPYKVFCGEYDTSTAFATWMASKLMGSGETPLTVSNLLTKPYTSLQNILIYNNYMGDQHSFILIQKA